MMRRDAVFPGNLGGGNVACGVAGKLEHAVERERCVLLQLQSILRGAERRGLHFPSPAGRGERGEGLAQLATPTATRGAFHFPSPAGRGGRGEGLARLATPTAARRAFHSPAPAGRGG